MPRAVTSAKSLSVASLSAYPLLSCFVLSTLLYFALRSGLDIVWNDTGTISEFLWMDTRSLTGYRDTFLEHPLTQVLRAFGSIGGDGYRPLSVVWYTFGIVFPASGVIRQTTWVAFVALVQGATVTTVFAVARRLLGRTSPAILATVFGMAAAPTVAAHWVVIVGFQNLVTLTVCGGLLLYFRWRDDQRWSSVVGLGLVLLLAPWVREFAGILAVLLLWLEFGIEGRFSIIAALGALGLAHAIYPTALVKLLYFHQLPLQNTFEFGALGRQVLAPQSATVASVFANIRWEAVPYALLLVPPIIACCLAILVLLPGPSLSLMGKRIRIAAWVPGAIIYSGLVILAALGYLASEIDSTHLPILLLWLLIGFGIAAFRVHPLLPAWLLASTLPFLKVFNQETHLLYAAVPAGIIVAGAAAQLWDRAVALHPHALRVAARTVLGTVIAVAVVDQAANLYGSYRFVRALNDAEHGTAEWLQNAVPAGSRLVGNAILTGDIQLFSAGHVQAYYTRAAGVNPERVADDMAGLTRFLAQTPTATPIYLLDADYDFASVKIAYHSHRYLWQPVLDVQEIGRLFTISVRYPFLDPLKLLVPRDFVSYLGPPDLVDDFYRGPDRSGTPFMRELFVVFDLYRVIDRTPHGWIPGGGPPKIVARNFRGFDVWEWGDGYFALPFAEQIPSPRDLLRVLRPAMCFGDSAKAVKQRIDSAACPTQQADFGRPTSPAVNKIGETAQFALYASQDESQAEFYAIPKSAEFDASALTRGNYRYSRWLAASSLVELKREINALPSTPGREWPWLTRPDIMERRH